MSTTLDVFDLGLVLVEVDFERFVAGVRSSAPSADPAVLRAVPDHPDKHALDRGRLAPWPFAERLIERLGAPPGLTADLVLSAWTDIFPATLPGAADAIGSLGDRERWLLSDTSPLHLARCLDQHPLVRSFDRYLLSYARGRLKADPGGMEPLAEQVRAGRTVRFFDDRPDNVAAARHVGVQAHLFTTWSAWERDHGDT